MRDEGFKFNLRLAKAGVDVFLKEYKYMPHGFLNYNAPFMGMKEESTQAIDQCANWIMDCILDKPE